MYFRFALCLFLFTFLFTADSSNPSLEFGDSFGHPDSKDDQPREQNSHQQLSNPLMGPEGKKIVI